MGPEWSRFKIGRQRKLPQIVVQRPRTPVGVGYWIRGAAWTREAHNFETRFTIFAVKVVPGPGRRGAFDILYGYSFNGFFTGDMLSKPGSTEIYLPQCRVVPRDLQYSEGLSYDKLEPFHYSNLANVASGDEALLQKLEENNDDTGKEIVCGEISAKVDFIPTGFMGHTWIAMIINLVEIQE